MTDDWESAEDGSVEEGADRVMDDLVPDDYDWRGIVRSYPIPALLVAGFAGYVLGRRRGAEILESLTDFAADQLVRNVNETLGDDVL